jgi:cytochrome bd-type quinol oxidase subunit 2
MKRIYLALAIYSTIFFVGASILGLELHSTQAESWKYWHLRAGLFVAIFVCFVHSLIFIHLLGTGLGIKRAIDEHKLREESKADLYKFKMRAFPPAFASMVATIATAVLGGNALTGGSATAHLVLAAIALVVNVLTFPYVVKQLGENERVLRDVEKELATKTAEVAPRP